MDLALKKLWMDRWAALYVNHIEIVIAALAFLCWAIHFSTWHTKVSGPAAVKFTSLTNRFACTLAPPYSYIA